MIMFLFSVGKPYATTSNLPWSAYSTPTTTHSTAGIFDFGSVWHPVDFGSIRNMYSTLKYDL